MDRRFRKLVCGILAGIILCSTVCSCAVSDENTSSDAAESVSDVAEDASETQLSDALPEDLNYKDDEIVILSRYREGWTSGEISVEKQTGETINDAVYERNKIVENRLGVTINSVERNTADQNDVINEIANAVATGTADYDILAGACYLVVNQSLSGTFTDLRSTDYIDFEKPWWSQGYNEVVEFQGVQFAVTGAMVLSLYRFAFATTFNKRLFKDAGVDMLYEKVRNGGWTLDYQASIVPLFYRDDGNGKQDEKGDVYGFVSTYYISTDPYWSSCDVKIIEKDEYGEYQMVFDSGKLSDVADKVLNLYYLTDNASYIYTAKSYDSEQDDIRNMFAEGWAAMATLRIMALESEPMRDMKDEFGVVPMPKFDEAQKDYRTLLHDQFTVVSIPTTVRGDRLTEVSAVMEAMASTSYKVVKPAYYETALRTKYVNDPDSAEMMDIITQNVYIDAGIIYTAFLSSFHDSFRGIIQTKKNTVASSYKSVAKSAGRKLSTMNSKLSKLAEKYKN